MNGRSGELAARIAQIAQMSLSIDDGEVLAVWVDAGNQRIRAEIVPEDTPPESMLPDLHLMMIPKPVSAFDLTFAIIGQFLDFITLLYIRASGDDEDDESENLMS